MNKKGFTLLETMLVVGILSFMAATLIPATIKMINLNQAKSVAKEITGIQEAERSYYVNQMNLNNGAGSWADTIQQLQQGGYIPSTWGGNSIFGNPYTITDNGSTMTVATTLPLGLQGVIQSDNIDVTTSDTTLSNIEVDSTIPVPAAEPALSGLVHRYGSGESRTATQSIGTTGSLVIGVSPSQDNVDKTIAENPDPIDNTNDGTNAETIPDIYDPALKIAGISKSGWLSQASFPTNLNTREIRIFGMTEIYLPADFQISSLYAVVTVADALNGYYGTYTTGYTEEPSNMQGMNLYSISKPYWTYWTGGGPWDPTIYCTGTLEGQSVSFTASINGWETNPCATITFNSPASVVSATTYFAEYNGDSFEPGVVMDAVVGQSIMNNGNEVIVDNPIVGYGTEVTYPFDTTIVFNI
jgi:prepilin-type N-terminal cleavage/methylation domain-containing protein